MVFFAYRSGLKVGAWSASSELPETTP